MTVLDNWKQWEDFLADRLHHAQTAGMNQNSINDLAYQIGGYLQDHVDPKNEQQRVLADLWSVADQNEQHAIANMMVKLIQNNGGAQQQQ